MTEQQARQYRAIIEQGAQTFSDAEALTVRTLYPEWADLVAAQYTTDKAGFKFLHSGDLYKTIPAAHTFAAQWVPGVGTESIYTRIDEQHDGSRYDPIPYNGNMELYAGQYYSQSGLGVGIVPRQIASAAGFFARFGPRVSGFVQVAKDICPCSANFFENSVIFCLQFAADLAIMSP